MDRGEGRRYADAGLMLRGDGMEQKVVEVPVSSEDLQRMLPEEFYSELMTLLREHGRIALRQDKIVSHETMDNRKELLVMSMRELRGLGFKLETPRNLQQRHVEALAKSWEERGLAASTIANRLSALRALSVWIGKEGMIQHAADFVRNPESVRRAQATTEDKSWTASGIDPEALIGMIEQYDWRVGLQIKLMKAFGLRRKEAVMFPPLKADLGLALRVRDGTKGGRERLVVVETAEQRAILDFAKSKVSHVNEHIGHPDLSLEQAIRRFNYVLERFGVTKRGLGVTSHGLRHQHLNDLYEKVAGVPSPVRSGSVTGELDRLTHDIARARVSQEAGHSRLAISSAYIGARTSAARTPEQKADWARIRELSAKGDVLSDADAAELGRMILKLNASLDAAAGSRQEEQERRDNVGRTVVGAAASLLK